MRAVIWIAENSWEACVSQAAAVLPADADVTLLHVSPSDVEELAAGGLSGRLGRRHPAPSGPPLRQIAAAQAQALLERARSRLGRDAALDVRRGRVEREVVSACADLSANLLVLARDGRLKLGPESLGPRARFVVDHAPCQVLVVWADDPPGVETIPRAPHERDGGAPPPGSPPRPRHRP